MFFRVERFLLMTLFNVAAGLAVKLLLLLPVSTYTPNSTIDRLQVLVGFANLILY